MVSRVIELYRVKGEPLDVNDPKQADEYISLLKKDLDCLLVYSLDCLDQDTKKALSEPYNDYGLAYLTYGGDQSNPSKNDLKKAKDIYLEAVKLDENNYEPLVGLSYIYQDIEKDYAAAIKCYNRVLEFKPDDIGAKWNKEICEELLRDKKE